MTRYELPPSPSSPEFAELVAAIAERIRAGEVGIIPTDTVHGLVCRYDLSGARERIYRMKRRDGRKPLQVLIGDVRVLAMLAIDLSPALELLADSFWPGPLTIVIADRHGREHGLRQPGGAFATALLSELNQPLAATSANLSGSDPVSSVANDFADLAEEPDFIVKADLPPAQSSTVVRLREDELDLLREGEISLPQLETTLSAGRDA